MLAGIREQIADVIAPHLKERRNLLEREANTDALTGLANRAAFDKAEPKARRTQAFILFDLNSFGLVNKKLGHRVGDRLLKYYADVIANVASHYKCRAFRYGVGDEFVIIADHRFSFQIRDAVERRALPRRFDGFTVSITGEVGYSVEDADSRLQARKQAKKSEFIQ